MRPIIPALIFVAIAGSACAAESPSSCLDAAVTQRDMNACAASGFKEADEQLNAVYQAVLSKHRAERAFVRNLQAAQRAWLAWRDAEMKAIFPGSESGNNGSAFPMCWHGELEQFTRERTKQLQKWLDAEPEGDVCGASYPRAER